jgi:hypothetical protein
MAILFSKDSVLIALRSSIPDAEWLLGKIESQEGWLRFPSFLSDTITNLKLENYPLLYSSEAAIVAMMLKGFLDEEEIRSLAAEFEAASLDDRGKFVEELIEGIGSAFESIEIPKTLQQQQAAQALFDKLPPEEQQQNIKVAQHFFCAFFATFYQNLSTMVHGEKLTSLVAQAQAGDDQAFVKAVQIDRRILTVLPYFRERYAKAQDAADSNFFDILSYRQRCAPYRGKIRHKSLWLTFSILDQAGLLDTLPHREILEMCDEAGVGGYENRVQDVKHLSKRIREFRTFQKRGAIATP